MAITIGADIGQARDHTAVVVCEARSDRFLTRAVEQLPLGVPYDTIVERLVSIVNNVQRYLQPRERLIMRVDCTGLGKPVFDHLLAACSTKPVGPTTIQGVVFRDGDRPITRRDDGILIVGKGAMVARLRSLFAEERLVLGPSVATDALVRELLQYEWRLRHRAAGPTIEYGALHAGTHDDLVTALGLAVLYDIHDIQSEGTVAKGRRRWTPRFLRRT